MLLPLVLTGLALAAGKPIEKSKDWVQMQPFSHQSKLGPRAPELRHCRFRAVRDTTLPATKTPAAADTKIGGICSEDAVLVQPQWTWELKTGAGGTMWWGTRADTGRIDLVFLQPGDEKAPFRIQPTDYTQGWRPFLAGTPEDAFEVVFLGRTEGEDTWTVDVVDATGRVRDTLQGVVGVANYGPSFLVELRRDGQTFHQVLDPAGRPLTPHLPGLFRRHDDWLVDAGEGPGGQRLSLPVLPTGQLGRSHPRLKGYIEGAAAVLGASPNRQWVSVWETPDGQTVYGIPNNDWTDKVPGRFVRVEARSIEGKGYTFLFTEDGDGVWSGWELHYANAPAQLVYGESLDAAYDNAVAFLEERSRRSLAQLEAFRAEQRAKAERKAAAERAAAEQAAALKAARAKVQLEIAAGDMQGALAKAQDIGHGEYCETAWRERFGLNLEQAHQAMVHCYHDLEYRDWMALDAVVQQLQRPAPVAASSGGGSWSPSSYSAPAIDWSAQHQQLQRDQFDRAWSSYIQGSSTYDPWANSYRP